MTGSVGRPAFKTTRAISSGVASILGGYLRLGRPFLHNLLLGPLQEPRQPYGHLELLPSVHVQLPHRRCETGVVQKLRHPQGSHSQGPSLPSAGDVDISVTAGIWSGGVPLSNAAQPLASITVVLVHDEAKQATVDGGPFATRRWRRPPAGRPSPGTFVRTMRTWLP